MNKTDLINAIAEGAGLNKVEAKKALDICLDSISEALKQGDESISYRLRHILYQRASKPHRYQSENQGADHHRGKEDYQIQGRK